MNQIKKINNEINNKIQEAEMRKQIIEKQKKYNNTADIEITEYVCEYLQVI